MSLVDIFYFVAIVTMISWLLLLGILIFVMYRIQQSIEEIRLHIKTSVERVHTSIDTLLSENNTKIASGILGFVGSSLATNIFKWMFKRGK